MATLVGVLNTSHAWIGRPIEEWDAIRAERKMLPSVPSEDEAEKRQKVARIDAAIELLKSKLATMRPDVLVVIGDDQSENFPNTFANIPTIAVYVGEQFAGRSENSPRDAEHQQVPGHPPLATAILTGLMARRFDPAFCMDLPNPARGIGHAIIHPLGYFTDYSIPTVPVIINALFAPQITAHRANHLGHALREIIDEYPEALRVVVIGSGGLWHTTVHGYNTYLNEEFDQTGLTYLSAGDLKGWAEHFDTYRPAEDDMSQFIGERRRDMTGLPRLAGPQFGTREMMNWIAASSVAEGRPFTIVDYVPIYASPIGTAFAYCDDIN